MPIRFTAAQAVLEGHCAVEEAIDLATWLLAKPGRKLDLAGCTGVHSAVLQCLMALAPKIVAVPADPDLAHWLAKALPADCIAPPKRPAKRRKRVAGKAPNRALAVPG
jgi:hypothetical protein